MKLPVIFTSPDSLRNAFVEGLERQIKEQSLGTFILVLANTLFDEKIFPLLKDRLQEKFETLSRQHSNRLRLGIQATDAPDDILVFKKILATGFNNLGTTDYRQTRYWELQYNQLRSLRPKRMSWSAVSRLWQEFNDNAFHFNKPFLSKEVFWSGDIDGVAIKLLYNKFPFATLHGLLVPQPDENLPQFLNADMHNFINELCRQIGKNIPDIAIAYNGFGAGASINHLHFQTFTRQKSLPVLSNLWLHNGGNQPYPTRCLVFENRDEAWQYITELHNINTTYDIIYLPHKIVCLPRKFQGSFEAPKWIDNFAWYELCGGIITFNDEDFLKLDDDTIYKALALLKDS
jgi:diadenosine tetraphosphate (Ap4A) HIT family hydrolase